jgi:hypothetical protein
MAFLRGWCSQESLLETTPEDSYVEKVQLLSSGLPGMTDVMSGIQVQKCRVH